jgi:2-methylisocitrate lyase-like PEP mutase family enzyme
VSDSAQTHQGAALLALHSGPGFIIPNAWDAGSARILERVGFPAIATTSAGIAWSYGVPDGGALDPDRMFERVAEIVAAVGVPVSADLEAGYGETPEAVHRSVARAVTLGVAGANIEDAVDGRLYPVDEAVERLAAARAAAPVGAFVLNARTDAYFVGGAEDPFAETVERAARFVDAGADCIFVPGVDDADTVGRLAQAIPAPLNIVAGLSPTVIPAPSLFDLGVRRVSVGGGLARAALSMLERAGRELRDNGTLAFLDGALSYGETQSRFERWPRRSGRPAGRVVSIPQGEHRADARMAARHVKGCRCLTPPSSRPPARASAGTHFVKGSGRRSTR